MVSRIALLLTGVMLVCSSSCRAEVLRRRGGGGGQVELTRPSQTQEGRPLQQHDATTTVHFASSSTESYRLPQPPCPGADVIIAATFGPSDQSSDVLASSSSPSSLSSSSDSTYECRFIGQREGATKGDGDFVRTTAASLSSEHEALCPLPDEPGSFVGLELWQVAEGMVAEDDGRWLVARFDVSFHVLAPDAAACQGSGTAKGGGEVQHGKQSSNSVMPYDIHPFLQASVLVHWANPVSDAYDRSWAIYVGGGSAAVIGAILLGVGMVALDRARRRRRLHHPLLQVDLESR